VLQKRKRYIKIVFQLHFFDDIQRPDICVPNPKSSAKQNSSCLTSTAANLIVEALKNPVNNPTGKTYRVP